MRRIYESSALSRDDEEPFKPGENDRESKPQSFRSINASAWSDRLLPVFVRRRAVSIAVSTPKTEYEVGEAIPFQVELKNSLPVPVTIPTDSPLLWSWTVDGYDEAAQTDELDPPEKPGKLYLDRGERKVFTKEWSQLFKVSEREWEEADPGEHLLGAYVNASEGELAAETTVRITPRPPS